MQPLLSVFGHHSVNLINVSLKALFDWLHITRNNLPTLSAIVPQTAQQNTFADWNNSGYGAEL